MGGLLYFGLAQNTALPNWASVHDYFYTRPAHDLAIKPELLPYSAKGKAHMAKRYVHYFSDKEYLANFAAPLLGDLLKSIELIKTSVSCRYTFTTVYVVGYCFT